MPYNPDHTAVAHFPAPPNTADLEKWAAASANSLAGPPNLALLFFSGDCADSVAEITEIVRIYARVPDVAGCGAEAHIADDREIEDAGGVTVALLHLPGTRLLPRHLPPDVFQAPDRREAFRKALGPADFPPPIRAKAPSPLPTTAQSTKTARSPSASRGRSPFPPWFPRAAARSAPPGR